MRLVLFESAGLPIYSYWFFYGLGLILAIFLAVWLGHRRALDLGKAGLLSVAAVISAVVFARLTAVFFGTRFSDLLDLQVNGQVSFGGSLGALLVIVLLAGPLRMRIGDVFDGAACAIPLAQGIQRIGCFLNGCCFGPVSTSFLSVRFPRGSACFAHHLETGLAGPAEVYSQPVFPIQLAGLVMCLVVSGTCVWLFLREKLRGKLLGLYLGLYGVGRFVLQWYRPDYDKDDTVAGWNTGHSVCLLMILAGLVVLLVKNPTKTLLLSKDASA